jgi:hypothetical protein
VAAHWKSFLVTYWQIRFKVTPLVSIQTDPILKIALRDSDKRLLGGHFEHATIWI